MKILKGILSFVFEIILAVSVIGVTVISLLDSTILNKEYIIKKIDSTNYYSQMYNYIESNFEKYIQQSGLDEDVISGLISEEQIKNDTKIIINNLYEGTNNQISSDELKQKLQSNITNSLGGKIAQNQQNSIDSFMKAIVDEYEENVLNYEQIKTINDKYSKVVDIAIMAKKASVIGIVISIVMLLILNLSQFYKFIADTGISSLSAGAFLVFANNFVNSKIDIKSILLLNDSFSEILRNILEEMVQFVQSRGIMFVVIGLALSLISALINNKKDEENIR